MPFSFLSFPSIKQRSCFIKARQMVLRVPWAAPSCGPERIPSWTTVYAADKILFSGMPTSVHFGHQLSLPANVLSMISHTAFLPCYVVTVICATVRFHCVWFVWWCSLICLFTARCTLVQSAVLPSHVVCLSVCNVGELWSHRLEFFENNFTIS